MNPETFIPFNIGDPPSCTESGTRQYQVSLVIRNALAQVVSIPVLQGGEAGGRPLDKLKLSCGTYKAWWNGKYTASGREASSGVYVYTLTVDGLSISKKMQVSK